MAVVVQPPLATPKHYDPMFKVDTMLHEPTLPTVCSSAEIGLDVMSMCFQLDILCKKEMLQQPSHSIHRGRTSNSFRDKANVVEDRMRQTVAKCKSSALSLQDYIEGTRLGHMFPRPEAFIADPHRCDMELDVTPSDEYMSCLYKLNQLSNLAHQLHDDIASLPRPKYLAHQLALFYQCMCSMPNPKPFAKYKKSIENNFKAVKHIYSADCEQDESLPDDLRQWVLELTNQVAALVESLPADLTQELLIPAHILSQL